jgi:hypothetical protein
MVSDQLHQTILRRSRVLTLSTDTGCYRIPIAVQVIIHINSINVP